MKLPIASFFGGSVILCYRSGSWVRRTALAEHKAGCRWRLDRAQELRKILTPEKTRDQQLHSSRSQPSDGVREQTEYLDLSPGSGDSI